MTIGIDLVRVEDVAAAIARFGDRYLRRVFTPAEIAYCGAGSPALAAQRFAARFAAKEATRKAIGIGDGGVAWAAIEVCRADDGMPTLRLHGTAATRARRVGVTALALSLTHEADYAAAVVTARIHRSARRSVPRPSRPTRHNRPLPPETS